jgi:hypothetical protein
MDTFQQIAHSRLCDAIRQFEKGLQIDDYTARHLTLDCLAMEIGRAEKYKLFSTEKRENSTRAARLLDRAGSIFRNTAPEGTSLRDLYDVDSQKPTYSWLKDHAVPIV